MKNNIFQFKKFKINQSKSAMKIGTDGVLLGAWTPIIKKPLKILDIGSGTGLIALMLVQRAVSSVIKAIEIEEGAAVEAAANFQSSPWSDRLELIHADVLNYTQKSNETFDLIVSNPPFFMAPFKVSEDSRSTARDNNHLRYEDLFSCVDQLLNTTGNFSMVCPFEYRNKLVVLGLENDLHLVHELHVKGSSTSSFKRILMRFEKTKSTLLTEELILEESRNQRTREHQQLVQDFYL